jgi:hypothetical protein
VLALSREQIQQMTAPWTCPKCGNRNSAGEMLCLSCGDHRQPVAATPPLENTERPGLPEPPAEKDRRGTTITERRACARRGAADRCKFLIIGIEIRRTRRNN